MLVICGHGDHKLNADYVRGPEDHPRLDDLLKRFTELGIYTYSQQRFLKVKGSKAIRREEDTWGKVQGKQSFQEFPAGRVTQDTLKFR